MKRFVMFLTAFFLLTPLFAVHADVIFIRSDRKTHPPQTKPDVPADIVASPSKSVPDEPTAPANTVASPPERIPDEPAALPNPAAAKGRDGKGKRNQKP